MVDISKRQIIDMINSRDYETVCKWLKTYPNLHVVSRDGSVTYNNAIADAHPGALQISDRFHLLKNLTSYGKEYLKKKLKPQILIQAVSQETSNEGTGTIKQADENRKLTLKEKYERIEQLLAAGKCKTAICQSINMDIRLMIADVNDARRKRIFISNKDDDRARRESETKNGTCE